MKHQGTKIHENGPPRRVGRKNFEKNMAEIFQKLHQKIQEAQRTSSKRNTKKTTRCIIIKSFKISEKEKILNSEEKRHVQRNKD